MEYPKISIVTPSFNQDKYIEQTILSILEQNYPNLEYIIIDGGSTDQTLEIIKKYQNHITYWESVPDRGQSHAINKGLNKATGDIFNWLNSDDYLARNYLHKVAEAFQDPLINCCCAYTEVFYDDGSSCYIQRPHIHDTTEKNMAYPLYSQQTSFFKKEVFERLKGVNEKLQYCMDREFWIRYNMLYPTSTIKMIRNIGAHYRLHTESKTISLKPKFSQDIYMIELSILKAMEAPDFLIKIIQNEIQENVYTPNLNWEIKEINKKAYLQYVLKKYLRENKSKISYIKYLNCLLSYFFKL